MVTVTKRELNQQTSRVLAVAQAEGAVIVTERGVPRWRIESVSGGSGPIDRLRATGRLIPAKDTPAPWARAGKARSAKEVDELIAESRADRAW